MCAPINPCLPADLKELVNDFKPVAVKWYAFGLQVGISMVELDIIKGRPSLVQDCFDAVIKEWLENGRSPPTKTTLLEALKSKSVNQARMASQIDASKLYWYRVSTQDQSIAISVC